MLACLILKQQREGLSHFYDNARNHRLRESVYSMVSIQSLALQAVRHELSPVILSTVCVVFTAYCHLFLVSFLSLTYVLSSIVSVTLCLHTLYPADYSSKSMRVIIAMYLNHPMIIQDHPL